MKVTAERIDNHKITLEMEVPQTEVAKALDKAYHKLANGLNIPGFRKGKAPRKVVEMRVGKQALLDEAFEILAPQVYNEALDEQKVEPVTKPEIEVVTLNETDPLVFKATFIQKPEITLGEYKGLKVECTVFEVSDEAVTKELEELRNRQAKMVVVEDAALETGDFAIIDFTGFIDGEPFKGGDAQGYPLEVGSGSFIPGFEDQLLGAKTGEEREVNVTFPEDYFVKELAGKQAQFKVKIQDIKRKELPEIDNEFVKDVSEFETVEELKADLRNKLEKAATDKADRDFRTAAVKQAVDNAQVDVPDVMVEERIDNMLNDLDINLQSRGANLEQYLTYTKTDMAKLRENYRESALYNVKTDLVMEQIAKTDDLQVSKEEMEAEIAEMAQSYNAPVDEVRKIVLQQNRIGALAAAILRKKAAQIIIDGAVKE